MKEFLFVLIALCLSSFKAWPQLKEPCQVKGRLVDKGTQQPLEGATVLLLYIKDSAQSTSAFTDAGGFFLLESIKEGVFKLYVSYLGYQTMSHTFMIKKSDTLVDMSVIHMQKTGVTLSMVEIVKIRPPMKIKKDTLEFDAGYYKIRENAVLEDLLMKLPGVHIGDDGAIKVNGISVERILVDGKPFFDDDLKLATRNLLVNIIDKVQLIDSESDKAQYLESNNAKKGKTINITVKEEKKGNLIGSATAGLGANDRFAGNVNLNQFGGKQQLSFLLGGNNINGSIDGGARIRMSSGGANGITQSWNGGVNYNKDFSKALKIRSSLLFNKDQTENQLNSVRQNLLPDTTYYYAQKANTANCFYNHFINARIEYTPDSMRSLIINTKFVYRSRNDQYVNFYESSSEERKMMNNGTVNSINSARKPNLDVNVLLNRKFRKPGRNIGVGIDFALNPTNGERFNKSFSLFIRPNGSKYRDTIDQRSEIKSRYLYTQVSITYTEPIFRGLFLEFSQTYTWRKSMSTQFTFDYNLSKERYDHLNDSLSNSFKNRSFIYLADIRISKKGKKYSYSLGLNMLYNNISSKNIILQSKIQQRTTNLCPIAYFDFELNNNRRLSFDYGGDLQLPDVEQLQPVINNSNPLYMQRGNADLEAAFAHNFALSYSHFNPLKANSFIVVVNAAFTSNKIANESWVDSLGRQLSKPITVNGCYNLNVDMEKVISLKEQYTSIKSNTMFAFRQDINYNNSIKVKTKGFSATQIVTFGCTFKRILDITTSASTSFIEMLYSPKQNNSDRYLAYRLSVNCYVNLPLGLTIGSSLDYKRNSNDVPGYSNATTLLDASLSKKVLRRKQAFIKVQILDLLNQNVGINHTINSSYIEDMQSMVMQRFFIVAFSYYLR